MAWLPGRENLIVIQHRIRYRRQAVDGVGAWLRTAHREISRALGRFRRLPPWLVLRDVVRAAQLSRHNPPPRPMPSRAERLVVTLTTVPPRAGDLTVVL